MLSGFWNRLFGRHETAQDDEIERERTAAEEHQAVDEPFEGKQADLATEARFGGENPENLLPDDEPRHH